MHTSSAIPSDQFCLLISHNTLMASLKLSCWWTEDIIWSITMIDPSGNVLSRVIPSSCFHSWLIQLKCLLHRCGFEFITCLHYSKRSQLSYSLRLYNSHKNNIKSSGTVPLTDFYPLPCNLSISINPYLRDKGKLKAGEWSLICIISCALHHDSILRCKSISIHEYHL